MKRKRAGSPKDNFFGASVYYDVLCDYVPIYVSLIKNYISQEQRAIKLLTASEKVVNYKISVNQDFPISPSNVLIGAQKTEASLNGICLLEVLDHAGLKKPICPCNH